VYDWPTVGFQCWANVSLLIGIMLRQHCKPTLPYDVGPMMCQHNGWLY